MNILPKKKWHVRTKENIARVRKDEAEAAAEAKEIEKRALLAEQEARTRLLRTKARARVERECPQIPEELKVEAIELPTGGPLKHVNLFEDLEAGETTASANKDNEEEAKKEKEDYEKKIGLLVYLGQDSQELTGEKTWWERIPIDRQKAIQETEEAGTSQGSSSKISAQKNFLDPLSSLRKYLGCEGVKRITSEKPEEVSKTKEKKRKHKRKRSSSSSSSDDDRERSKKRRKKDKKKRKKKKKVKEESESDGVDAEEEIKRQTEKKAMIDKLRVERLERERKEREKTEILLYGESKRKKTDKEKLEERIKETRKYNNQFNPDTARQNKLDSNKKYWLE